MRVNSKREIMVKEIIGFMNPSNNAPTRDEWKAHEMDFFAHFALCPNFVEKIKSWINNKLNWKTIREVPWNAPKSMYVRSLLCGSICIFQYFYRFKIANVLFCSKYSNFLRTKISSRNMWRALFKLFSEFRNLTLFKTKGTSI